MLTRLLLAAAIAAISAASARAEAITYLGELAGKPIVVELTADPADGADATLVGRYAYGAVGVDIPLHAISLEGSDLVLYEERFCTEDICGADHATATFPEAIRGPIWTLRLSEDGNELTGTWQADPDARSFPVRLGFIGARPYEPADTPSPSSLAERPWDIETGEMVIDDQSRPYEYFKLASVDPVSEGEVRFGSALVRYLVDPRTKFRFPQLVDLGGADPVPGNAFLLNRHRLLSLAALDCEASRHYYSLGWFPGSDVVVGHLGSYPDEQIEVTYLSQTLVTWTESGSLSCGGAHPYNHADSYSLDLATGRPLDLGRVFAGWTSDEYGGTPPEALIDFVSARRSTLADPDFDAECAISDLIPQYLGVRFERDDRVTFTLEGLPHAIVACGEDLLTLPLADLRPLLAPEAKSYFPSLTQ